MKLYSRIIVGATLLFSTTSIVFASRPVSGTITAIQTCEAYVSKNKLTNPDDTKLVIDQKYSIYEANKANNPDWFRIRIDNATPQER